VTKKRRGISKWEEGIKKVAKQKILILKKNCDVL